MDPEVKTLIDEIGRGYTDLQQKLKQKADVVEEVVVQVVADKDVAARPVEAAVLVERGDKYSRES